MTRRTRRQFLQEATVGSAAAFLSAHRVPLEIPHAVQASPWASRIGLELYTVRDLLASDYEGTLAQVAAIGYTEVEPTSYNNMSPKEFRALLDRYKLSMPSTHAPARGSGAELEIWKETGGTFWALDGEPQQRLRIGCTGVEATQLHRVEATHRIAGPARAVPWGTDAPLRVALDGRL
jgi:hypothetical protein